MQDPAGKWLERKAGRVIFVLIEILKFIAAVILLLIQYGEIL